MSLVVTLTIVALPALWLLNRDSESTDGAPPEGPAPSVTAADDSDPLLDDMARNQSIYMSGDGTRNPSAVADIDLQQMEPGEVNRARASYSSAFAGQGFCVGSSADIGTELTITNVSNNRSTTCVVVESTERVSPSSGIIVLERTSYLSIANVADAPVPVEIRR